MLNTMGKKEKVEHCKGDGECLQKGAQFQIGWSGSILLRKDLQEMGSELCRFPSRGDPRRADDHRGVSDRLGAGAATVRERGLTV